MCLMANEKSFSFVTGTWDFHHIFILKESVQETGRGTAGHHLFLHWLQVSKGKKEVLVLLLSLSCLLRAFPLMMPCCARSQRGCKVKAQLVRRSNRNPQSESISRQRQKIAIPSATNVGEQVAPKVYCHNPKVMTAKHETQWSYSMESTSSPKY